MPASGPPPPGCECIIQQSIGLPCFHTIWERKRDGGVIQLEDIHHHWYYFRPDRGTSSNQVTPVPLPLLNPMPIKGKGRPKGALGGVSRIPESSTKRHPSAFELPSSSAPPILERSTLSSKKLFIVHSGLSSTTIGMSRIQAGHQDLYEPGTRRERAYMSKISSVYQTDSIVDSMVIADNLVLNETQDYIEVGVENET